MREFRTSGSVGAPGEQSPGATRQTRKTQFRRNPTEATERTFASVTVGRRAQSALELTARRPHPTPNIASRQCTAREACGTLGWVAWETGATCFDKAACRLVDDHVGTGGSSRWGECPQPIITSLTGGAQGCTGTLDAGNDNPTLTVVSSSSTEQPTEAAKSLEERRSRALPASPTAPRRRWANPPAGASQIAPHGVLSGCVGSQKM
jgi:hypothetical protein